MKPTDISEVLSFNADHIDLILYPVRNSKISRSSHAYETIQDKLAQARKHSKYYDFTNARDGIKALVILSSGVMIGLSLTREKINLSLDNKRNTKARKQK